MVITHLSYIPKYFTKKSIFAFFLIIVFVFFFFSSRQIPIQAVLFNCIEVFGFFFFSNKFTREWGSNPVKVFQKKLLYISFFIRLVWVVFSYYYFINMTGIPFEFEAGDSVGYNTEAKWLASLLTYHKWQEYRTYVGDNFSDMGYPFYLGLIYYVVGESILGVRIIKALISSYMCLIIYKLARNSFGEKTGRIAGIMTMLVPNLIYYCGLHVKETEMVFLAVCFVYLTDKLLRATSVRFIDILLVMLFASSLFFFRTVLACSLIGSVAITTILISRRISSFNRRFIFVILFLIGGYTIISTPVVNNINDYIKESDKNLISQMNSYATRDDGSNKFARYGSRGVFLPFMLIAPFPSLVDTHQPNAVMLGGAFFTRNVYAFFIFIGLFALYKRKELRNQILLLLVIGSYIFVLASSGFALSERFHLPLIPFLLVLAAYGVSETNKKNTKYYIPYLVFVSFLVIGWNWFKIAGRS